MEEKNISPGRNELISKLRERVRVRAGILTNPDREVAFRVEGHELAPLHQRIDNRCRRNWEEIEGSWAEGKGSVVRD